MITIYVVMKDLKNQNREIRHSILYTARVTDFFFKNITIETLKLKMFRITSLETFYHYL